MEVNAYHWYAIPAQAPSYTQSIRPHVQDEGNALVGKRLLPRDHDL